MSFLSTKKDSENTIKQSAVGTTFPEETVNKIKGLEQEASSSAESATSVIGLDEIIKFVRDVTEGTPISGVIVEQGGSLDFVSAEAVFFKLPGAWLSLVEKSLRKLIDGLDGFTDRVNKREKTFTPITKEAIEAFNSMGLEKFIKEGNIKDMQGFMIDKSGKTIPIILTGSTLKDKTKIVQGMVVVAKDLRQLKEYAKSRLAKITPVLQKVATGDFSQKLEIPKDEDEFTEHLVALNLMFDDFREMVKEINQKQKELEAQNEELEKTSAELEGAKSGLEDKVSERTVELEIAKNKSDILLASIGDGVFGIDKEQKIIYFNQRAEEISGYKADEVIGKQYYDILKFVKVKDKSENTEFIRKALRGYASIITNHTILIRKDKKEVPVADAATPIKDKGGEILGAVVIFRDASQERELEQARTELISFAGHQLKAPLTYIAGNIEMLKEGKLNAESKNLVEQIESGVNDMKKLVRDVLNISRIEQGKIELKPEPTQLEKIVDDIIKESAPVAEKRNVKIEFIKPSQPLPEFMIDPQYIHEIYKNIISNAIKYTKDTITISFNKEGDNAIFKCSDNGIGIPEDEQSKIFSKFYIASNALKSETKGTGLGLSIAKTLIEKMNGKIWFESEEAEGATFYVSLPFVS